MHAMVTSVAEHNTVIYFAEPRMLWVGSLPRLIGDNVMRMVYNVYQTTTTMGA